MNDLEEFVASNRVVSEVLAAEEELPVDEALRYACSLAQALRRMHQEGRSAAASPRTTSSGTRTA